jgi:DNA-binding response OmpR family regulator
VSGNNISLLVIDDNQALLETMSIGLEADGFTVATAPDGKKGLDKASAIKPHLILLDVRLPDIDGFQVCRELRRNPDTAATPVILVTGDRTVDIDKGFAVGADDCIMKPVDLGYLSNRILKLVNKRNKVLVIDDDRQICDMLARIIIDQQCDAHVCHDGMNMMDVVRSEKPDLVLLDISLPVGPDGVELCRTIKNDPEAKTIPVIMLTANEHMDSIEKCFEYGAEDYIFKPFNINDLLLRVRKYIKFGN